MRTIRHWLLVVVSLCVGERIVRWMLRHHIGQMACDWSTDKFVEVLMKSLALFACISKDFRRNLKDFEATYLFSTTNGGVHVTACVARRRISVSDQATKNWDTKVRFKDGSALRRFLSSRDHDILNALLANDVEVQGNLNLMFRLGFLARDIQHRLGVG